MVNIVLHIEELFLHGFDTKDKHRIGTAVQDELTRLLGERGAAIPFDQDIRLDRIDGGSFRVREGQRPDSIGIRIGQAVYKGLGMRQDSGKADDP